MCIGRKGLSDSRIHRAIVTDKSSVSVAGNKVDDSYQKSHKKQPLLVKCRGSKIADASMDLKAAVRS